MKNVHISRHFILLALGFSSVLASASWSAAASARILRIVVVEVQDPASYIKEVKRGKPILKRLGIEGEIRVLQATYAGKETGMVIVTFEFGDKASFARSEGAFENARGDREYDAWVKDLEKIRKLTSDSLFDELDTQVGDKN